MNHDEVVEPIGRVWSYYSEQWLTPEELEQEKLRRRNHQERVGTEEDVMGLNNSEGV